MRPRLILLDLTKPLIESRQALRGIKAHPKYASNPIVVLSASHAESGVFASYRVGARSTIVKPSSFDDLVEITHIFYRSRFGLVKSPLL